MGDHALKDPASLESTSSQWRRDAPDFYSGLDEKRRARFERLREERERRLAAKNSDTDRSDTPPKRRKTTFRRVTSPHVGDSSTPGAPLWAETINLTAPWRKLEYPGWALLMSAVSRISASSCRRYLHKGGSGGSGVPSGVARRVALWLRGRAALFLSLAERWESYADDRDGFERTVIAPAQRKRLQQYRVASWNDQPPPPPAG